MDFKIGDMVSVWGETDQMNFHGEEGVIRGIKGSSYQIEFRVAHPNMHDLGGLCPNHKGYNVRRQNLKLVDPFIYDNTWEFPTWWNGKPIKCTSKGGKSGFIIAIIPISDYPFKMAEGTEKGLDNWNGKIISLKKVTPVKEK